MFFVKRTVIEHTHYFNLSNNNFIIKLHSGDERVFKEIFKKYYLPVRSFAWRFVKDNDIAEDIVQDCFLNVWEKRLTFNVITEIRNYLYTSTRNACLDHLKHEQIKQKHAIQLLTTASQEEEQEYILEEEVDRDTSQTSTKDGYYDIKRRLEPRNCSKIKYYRKYSQIHKIKGVSNFTQTSS